MEHRADVSWYLVKYLADPRRREPRNVGVLLHHSGQWRSRFVGEKRDGGIDRRHLRPYHLDAEVYGTWVDYFRRKTMHGDWEGVQRAQQRGRSNFYVELGGHNYEEADAETLLDWLFNELVVDPSTIRVPALLTQPSRTVLAAAEEVLKSAHIDFETNVSVPARFGESGRLTQVRFPLRHINGQMHLMDTIKPARDAEIKARELFARITAARQAGSARSFLVFYSYSDTEMAGQLESLLLPLEEQAVAVDIDNQDAAASSVIEVISRGSHGLLPA